MTPGVMICIIGIDGSGKTTLARALVTRLQSAGYDARYVYGRVQPFLSRFLMWGGRVFVVKGKKREIFENYNEYSERKRQAFNSGIVAGIFTWSLLFDQIIQGNLKFRFRLFTGRCIVCDRYVYDTVLTDIAPDRKFTGRDARDLIEFTFRTVPRPDLTILVDVPEEIAFGRKDDVPDIRYLQERRHRYLELEDLPGVVLLDGSKGIDEVSAEAYREVVRVAEEKYHDR
jgi:thymidylate kinase